MMPDNPTLPLSRFLDGLAKLSEETGIVVWGCGCCGSPSLEDIDETRDSRVARPIRYRIGPAGSNLEIVEKETGNGGAS